jgi:hypothetical protein
VTNWWYPEFVRLTGFVQYRNGNVPKVRTSAATVEKEGILIRWDVAVFGLFENDWFSGREHASFTRSVVLEPDLRVLWECATLLGSLELATSIPAPAAPASTKPSKEEQAKIDRAFYDALGPERPGKRCAEAGCSGGTVAFSVVCRAHHFAMVTGRPWPDG